MIDFTIEGSRELHFKKNKPYGMRYARKHTNPHYLDSRAFQENCQRCVMTYELLRRGYNVEAKPKENDYWSNVTHWPELFSKDSPNRTNLFNFRLLSQIKEEIKDGERWALLGASRYYEGQGHAFIVERHGERLYSIDPQINKTGVLSEYWKASIEMWGIRLDDKTFTEKMKEICFER